MALLTESLILDFGVLLLGILAALYVYFTRNFNVWMKKGIPFPKPTPFIGNFKDALLAKKSIGHFLQDVYNENKGKPYVGIFILDQPLLVVRDIEIIKSILVKDFNKFVNRNFAPNEVADPLSAKGLFGLNNDRWRHLRMKLTPTFTSGKMKMMFQFIDECGKELTTYLEHNSDEFLNIKDAMARYTTDVISSTIFGIQGDSLKNPDSHFRKILKGVFEFSFIKNMKLAAMFFTPGIAKLLRFRLLDQYIIDFARKTIWDTVEHRERNGIVRKDFLELLMQIRNKGNAEEDSINGDLSRNDKELKKTDKYELEGDDFVAQSFTFLTAGFETSSTTMSFALYELALQPEIQQKARDEIRAVLEKYDGKFTYDGFQEMTYLQNVLSGSRMGLLQAKVGLAHVLSQFEVSPTAKTPIPLTINPKSFVMSSDGPLPLAFTRLKT